MALWWLTALLNVNSGQLTGNSTPKPQTHSHHSRSFSVIWRTSDPLRWELTKFRRHCIAYLAFNIRCYTEHQGDVEAEFDHVVPVLRRQQWLEEDRGGKKREKYVSFIHLVKKLTDNRDEKPVCKIFTNHHQNYLICADAKFLKWSNRKFIEEETEQGRGVGVPFLGSRPTSASYHRTMVSEGQDARSVLIHDTKENNCTRPLGNVKTLASPRQ